MGCWHPSVLSRCSLHNQLSLLGNLPISGRGSAGRRMHPPPLPTPQRARCARSPPALPASTSGAGSGVDVHSLERRGGASTSSLHCGVGRVVMSNAGAGDDVGMMHRLHAHVSMTASSPSSPHPPPPSHNVHGSLCEAEDNTRLYSLYSDFRLNPRTHARVARVAVGVAGSLGVQRCSDTSHPRKLSPRHLFR
jgi:hypothetical protein